MNKFVASIIVEPHAKILNTRPWHDMRAIARACAITCANQEKGSLGGQ